MQLTPQSALVYLRERSLLAPDEAAEIRELSGGVSSTVLLIHPQGDKVDFVLKQALPQLKVQQQWLCSPQRAWREVDVLQICSQLLKGESGIRVPDVLFDDRENYCFAMSAAPEGHKTWKHLLLAGEADAQIATACGCLLGVLHAKSWGGGPIPARLVDRSFFDALRLDPYYRRLAEVHPDLALALSKLIDETYATRQCLVHGDFSPKNLLVSPGEIWLIDFEVGHFGDPAFDLGFFLTHLALKAIHAAPRQDAYFQLIDAFWQSYQTRLAAAASARELADLSRRAALHWSACLLARIDGKSPVDYLTPAEQQHVRSLSRQLLVQAPRNVEEVLSRIRTPR